MITDKLKDFRGQYFTRNYNAKPVIAFDWELKDIKQKTLSGKMLNTVVEAVCNGDDTWLVYYFRLQGKNVRSKIWDIDVRNEFECSVSTKDHRHFVIESGYNISFAPICISADDLYNIEEPNRLFRMQFHAWIRRIIDYNFLERRKRIDGRYFPDEQHASLCKEQLEGLYSLQLSARRKSKINRVMAEQERELT
ncbi:hypothetical protein D770_05225 [Flammeovirgaceae bacterium 311]|nr:hypothetical protein D770_05225 [Flammeovirgaceae bacterium 311]